MEKRNLEDSSQALIDAEEAFLYDVQFAIQWLMREKGISQADLAKDLGVTEPRVSQMLGHSGRNLTLRTVGRVFALLGETCEISSPGLEALKNKIWSRALENDALNSSGVHNLAAYRARTSKWKVDSEKLAEGNGNQPQMASCG